MLRSSEQVILTYIDLSVIFFFFLFRKCLQALQGQHNFEMFYDVTEDVAH